MCRFDRYRFSMWLAIHYLQISFKSNFNRFRIFVFGKIVVQMKLHSRIRFCNNLDLWRRSFSYIGKRAIYFERSRQMISLTLTSPNRYAERDTIALSASH